MSSNKLLLLGVLVTAWIAVAVPASAQLQPQEPDPLARMRAAAGAQSQACTIKGPSACAEATPKIVANALSSPNLAENIRDLAGHGAAAGLLRYRMWTGQLRGPKWHSAMRAWMRCTPKNWIGECHMQ